MNDLLSRIRDNLRKNADEKISESGRRFFKEEVRLYGMKTDAVRRLGKEFFKEIRNSDRSDIFSICEELWKSGWMEESFIACEWAYSQRQHYQPEDFEVFERWVSLYVHNWASCDTLCNHTIGSFIEVYPEFLDNLKSWAMSGNRWMKRAAAVSCIIPARNGRFLDEVFEIADLLLADSDDLVCKGYGWMLKAASEANCDAVFEYVMKNKSTMPRTALRYAIEKMPKEMKAEAMKK